MAEGPFDFRTCFWFGWNVFAILTLAGAAVAASLTHLVCESFRLASQTHSAVVAIAAGVAILVSDAVLRSRSSTGPATERLFSHRAGAAMWLVPGWILSLWVIGAGVAMLAGVR